MQLLHYQIALTLIPGIGDVLAKNLIGYCGSLEAVFCMKKQQLMRVPGIGEKLARQIASFRDFDRAEEEVQFIRKNGIQPLFYLDEAYPRRLREIEDAPVMLYTKGKADLNNPKCVAIVGTRRSTEYGKLMTAKLVEALKPTGCLILSGLALGIDSFAHKAALDNELPTVGVLAHGLDRIYPPQNQPTSRKMELQGGGLITEFHSGTQPDKVNFPQRNRIVAGLCDVLVVIETAVRGGAMITAEIANSYNKDILAVPGRLSDEYSAGCNRLIHLNKAGILTSPQDLFELMNWDLKPGRKKSRQPSLFDLNTEDQHIVTYIHKHVRTGIDALVNDLSLDPGPLSLRLLDLEFRNIIRTLPGKFYELV
ncbi:MAG: DNA-processing protein DprA [Bacteroidia bacterium]